MWTNLISEAMRAVVHQRNNAENMSISGTSKKHEMRCSSEWGDDGWSQNNIDLRCSNVKTTAAFVVKHKFSRNFARHLSHSFKLASTTTFKGVDDTRRFCCAIYLQTRPVWHKKLSNESLVSVIEALSAVNKLLPRLRFGYATCFLFPIWSTSYSVITVLYSRVR